MTNRRSASFASLNGTDSFAESQKGIYRELKFLACFLCFLGSVPAQVITVTAPSTNEAIGAHVFDYTLKASCTSCPSVMTIK